MHATEELRVFIRTIVDQSGLRQTQQSMQQTTRSLGAAAVAGGIAGAAADLLADQVRNLAGVFADSIQAAREHERVIRATGLAYGAAAGQYQRFAQTLSATTGFTTDAILEAALSARTLSQNYGLTVQQTQRLISVSADLARTRGIGIAESFERVQSAIRGEAEASEYLGLTLNDTYLTNQAMNGSLKSTFGTMTDVQKAQVRYNELLKQSAQFTDLAKGSTDSLDASFGRAAVSGNKLQIALGNFAKGPAVQGLRVLSGLADIFAQGFAGEDINSQRFRKFLEAIPGHTFPEAAAIAQTATFPGVTAISNELADIKDKAPAAAAALYDVAAAAKRIHDAAAEAVLPHVTVISNALADLKEKNDAIGRDALAAARLAYLDQVDAAVREIQSAQERQTDLQHEAVDLAAQEAQIKLSMLPTQERLAALQRDITERQARARLAALPATEALEDLRYEQERARLIASNRNATAADRSAARREIRGLARAEPGVALAALEAGRPVTLVGREGERAGLEQQLFQVTQEGVLAQTTLAQETNRLLSQIAEQRTQAIQLTINVGDQQFRTDVYTELAEANAQSQTPPATQSSAVRRGGPS